jgi:hypothetical protein
MLIFFLLPEILNGLIGFLDEGKPSVVVATSFVDGRTTIN